MNEDERGLWQVRQVDPTGTKRKDPPAGRAPGSPSPLLRASGGMRGVELSRVVPTPSTGRGGDAHRTSGGVTLAFVQSPPQITELLVVMYNDFHVMKPPHPIYNDESRGLHSLVASVSDSSQGHLIHTTRFRST